MDIVQSVQKLKGGYGMYDYLVVGAGLYGAVFAQQKKEQGFRCLVVDRRNHIAGNIYSEKVEGIEVHRYGPHIFHTADKKVWSYVNRFADFNHFIYSPVANFRGELYNLPFNMNTFVRMWGIRTPKEAHEMICRQVAEAGILSPKNLEEQAISQVGTDIYEKLVKGYTQKQWGRPCRELPASIIKRLPVRMTFDNNYFNHPYQGIPKEGYTEMVRRMLDGIEVRLGVDFLEHKRELAKLAGKIVYTGPIDTYFGSRFGKLEYRSLRFETEVMEIPNYQGVAGMNFTDEAVPYTRIVEHKHFTFGEGNPQKTVVTKEYPKPWAPGTEPYYPVGDDVNHALYQKYKSLADKEENLKFGGRLGTYRYMDMDQTVAQAMEDAR